jgi:hypothetical protein
LGSADYGIEIITIFGEFKCIKIVSSMNAVKANISPGNSWKMMYFLKIGILVFIA